MRRDLKDAERKQVAKFIHWFETSGGRLHRSLEYAQDDLMGLSIYSTADLTADAIAIAVPRDICISAVSAARSIVQLFQDGQGGENKREEEDALHSFSGKEWVIFYLFLHKLQEKIEGDRKQSQDDDGDGEQKRKRPKLASDGSPAKYLRHREYVALLPEETITPLHFTKEEVSFLRSTPLFGHAIESRKNGRKSFVKAIRWLHAQLERMKSAGSRWVNDVRDLLGTPFEAADQEEDIADLEQELEKWGDDEKKHSLLRTWRWAETAYGSRAFPPRVIGETQDSSLPAPVLIPGLDSFNHSRGAKVTWTWNDEPTHHVTLTLHNTYTKGEQVFNTYGPKSNEELLASYGFVNEGSEDDSLTLKLGGFEELPVQQYYWKLHAACPPGLLDTLQIAFRMQCGENMATIEEDANTPEDKYDVLMGKVNIADHLVQLLEAKKASFDSSQALVNSALKRCPSNRAAVALNIAVYRKSQAAILSHAIEWTEAYSEERVRVMAETLECSVEELFTVGPPN